jgi:hypothetical protein
VYKIVVWHSDRLIRKISAKAGRRAGVEALNLQVLYEGGNYPDSQHLLTGHLSAGIFAVTGPGAVEIFFRASH